MKKSIKKSLKRNIKVGVHLPLHIQALHLQILRILVHQARHLLPKVKILLKNDKNKAKKKT